MAGILWVFLSTLPRGERLDRKRPRPGLVKISIHAPARGATPSVPKAGAPEQNFYPRSRKGSNPPTCHAYHRGIHFYPRSREGSDVTEMYNKHEIMIFLSTLPRGERQAASAGQGNVKGDFYPRSREGSDSQAFQKILHVLLISIHAPARGATVMQ